MLFKNPLAEEQEEKQENKKKNRNQCREVKLICSIIVESKITFII